jgi:pimeloyl-ACP methyl ester carboxylesterase
VSDPPGLFVIDHPAGGYGRDETSASTGPVVVLLHGVLDRANSFRRTIRRLEEYRVVSYDRRGYQDSRGSDPPVGVNGHIADLLGVLDEIGEPAVVVGHSLGGVVAIGAAIAEPDRFAAVGAFESPLRWTEGTRAGTIFATADSAVESFFRAQTGNEAWDRLEPAARADRLADGPALITELTSLGEGPLFDVTKLEVPAVFGSGGASDESHKETAAWLVDNVSGSEWIEIAGSGHGAHLTHPDAFADFVRSTIARAR